MLEVINESYPVARKTYRCMASEYVIDLLNQGVFNFSEYRDIVRMRRQGWEIQKGQKYYRQVNKDGGELHTFIADIEMDAICRQNDLYWD